MDCTTRCPMSTPSWHRMASACPKPPFSASNMQPEAGTQWLTAHGSAPARAKQAKDLNKATALQAQAHLTGHREAHLMALPL